MVHLIFSILYPNFSVSNIRVLCKIKINRVWTEIKSYLSYKKQYASNPTEFNDNMAAAALTSVEEMFTNIVPINIVESLPKRVSHSVFFESLISEVKKSALWIQKQLFICKRLQVQQIELELDLLKQNFQANFNSINVLEKKLKEIRELDLINQLRDYKIFECISAEKPNSNFLNIAKKSNADQSLAELKNNGVAFGSENERNEHIVNFYSKLYDKNHEVNGEIDDFLGPEVAGSAQVKASKLTEEEKVDLDRPLHINELDISLKKVNMKSAPGIDGFSYRFICKYWDNFRVPLFNCANECLENGNLPSSFTTAQIKLIPKKGNCESIKNWRPISLLSNFYKIISRLINNRLKKITSRVLSRGQKGFNQSRQLHEVIINALENMNFCTVNRIKGVIVSIDMAKAFDSVSHGYLKKVFQFFNFGERMQRWLTAIGTGRKAHIILENGKLSDPFDLKRGTAQGDSPSPLIYNLAAQILIFKIELTPSLTGIYTNGNPEANLRVNLPNSPLLDTSHFA